MQNFRTKNFSIGKNSKEILVLHHTGTPVGTTQGNINACVSGGRVSFHYLVNEFGETFSFNNEDFILRHAGLSERNGKKELNRHSIGIEVIGPPFSNIQKNAVENLMIDIIKRNGIKKENIVRHKDISPGRKNDIDDSFWNDKYKNWEEYKNYLFTKIQIMGFYEKMFKDTYGKGTVFNDIDGALKKCINKDGSLNSKEFFYLIMIGLERSK